MELSFDEIIKKLDIKIINFNNNKLKELVNEVSEITLKVSNILKDDIITGYEKSNNIQGTNPLLWELGHISYHYYFYCLKYLLKNNIIKISNEIIYDSFKTDRESRFEFKDNSKDYLFQYYEYVIYSLNEYLNSDRILNSKITYLILLAIMHNHMHCESFIFTNKLLGYSNPMDMSYYLENNNIEYKWVKIPGGDFYQGTYEGQYNITFDNEMPNFLKKVDTFEVLNILITEIHLRDFILKGGYYNNELWSDDGLKWKNKNKINLPLYWKNIGNKYYILEYNQIREIKPNFPACHLSWYEAEAVCKWMGGRLPTESEWEYMATNCGINKFPWGNDWTSGVGNIDYSGGLCDVNEFKKGANNYGVLQLIGNVWEWCQESIYPYDGFIIDPVYREFSYPFFGFKKILKGGSWAVPQILIHPKYRNAQMPDMRMQFTGVRVVR
jgi:iron(II)-dependent oxidoreductase